MLYHLVFIASLQRGIVLGIRVPPSFSRTKFAHIIAPVPFPSQEQQLVFQTLPQAKEKAESTNPLIQVDLYAVQVAEDPKIEIPKIFSLTQPLTRSTKTEYQCKKALPFAMDVVQALRTAAPDADFYILSNADINAFEDLYLKIQQRISEGYDGLDVFKVLAFESCGGEKLAQNMTRAIEIASKLPQYHLGHDFFVWKKDAMDQIISALNKQDVFLGFAPFGTTILTAMNQAVKKLGVIQGEHWTFHVGGPGENSGHSPGNELVLEVMLKQEADHPGCKFYAESEAPTPEPSKPNDCDYDVLNDMNGHH